MAEHRRWWGEFAIEDDAEWRIGPMGLWINRSSREWRITTETCGDPLDGALTVAASKSTEPGDEADLRRFAFRELGSGVRLLPMLADRPLVVRPADPFHLPSGEEAILYVSSPLWVEVSAGQPWQMLFEAPIHRPSDTWFGANTLTGQLCYASRTAARLDLENLPIRPHRAVSAVRILNRASDKLLLERIKLPMGNLSLFVDSFDQLWTEMLTLEREEDGDLAKVRFEETPPEDVVNAEIVTTARKQPEKGFLTEAFGGLFAKKERDR